MADTKSEYGLIFIPDISGFTKFVNDTEIDHSQHIIRELFEVIIDANSLDLELSEIEGDAVLFFRLGKAPSAAEIVNQAKQIFIEFHKYLKVIERDRVCHCGACRTASGLTLKIIAHFGEIGISDIKGHKKLIGKSVVVAHRLMKNEIDDNEYLLMSDDYYSSLEPDESKAEIDRPGLQKGTTAYEHIGEINYRYMTLSGLHASVPAVPDLEQLEKYPDPVFVENTINSPISDVYSVIIDLDKRPLWSDGLRKIEYDRESIHRVGTRHVCELPGGKIELETVISEEENDTITYAERTTASAIFRNATSFFILKKTEFGTLFRIEFHYQKIKFFGKFIDLIFRKKLANGLRQSTINLKQLCESS